MNARYDPDRIRRRIQKVRLGPMHRMIGSDHRDSPLGAVASPSRFSDPAGKFAVALDDYDVVLTKM